MGLIDDIKASLELEVRSCKDTVLVFAAVFRAKESDKLLGVLQRYIGDPLKPPGKNVRLQKEAAKIANSMGGIRREQSFYMKEESDGYLYAALWPWESDPSRVTLKIGKELR